MAVSTAQRISEFASKVRLAESWDALCQVAIRWDEYPFGRKGRRTEYCLRVIFFDKRQEDGKVRYYWGSFTSWGSHYRFYEEERTDEAEDIVPQNFVTLKEALIAALVK